MNAKVVNSMEGDKHYCIGNPYDTEWPQKRHPHYVGHSSSTYPDEFWVCFDGSWYRVCDKVETRNDS